MSQPDHIETLTCLECNGAGDIRQRETNSDGTGVWVIDDCPSCSGIGQTLY